MCYRIKSFYSEPFNYIYHLYLSIYIITQYAKSGLIIYNYKVNETHELITNMRDQLHKCLIETRTAKLANRSTIIKQSSPGHQTARTGHQTVFTGSVECRVRQHGLYYYFYYYSADPLSMRATARTK